MTAKARRFDPEPDKIEHHDDVWRHRTSGMRCASCMWFVEKSEDGTLGRCRRNAPTMSGYPVVFDTDWCGQHKIDEEKLIALRKQGRV